MKIYLLSDYEEHGSENVHATINPNELPFLLRKYWGTPEDWHSGFRPDLVNEWLNNLPTALPKAEANPGQPINLSKGWGGVQLHVVVLE